MYQDTDTLSSHLRSWAASNSSQRGALGEVKEHEVRLLGKVSLATDVAIDTLFLCFLQDSEINDGSKEKPFFMSKYINLEKK